MEDDAPTTEHCNTISEAAQAIGVDERTLKTWLSKGAPKKSESGYDVEAIKKWREFNGQQIHSVAETDEEYERRLHNAKLEKLEGESAKVNAEAVLKQYQVREVAEDLLLKLEVSNDFAEALTGFSSGLQKIPAQMAAGYAPELQDRLKKDLQDRLELELRALRGHLDKYLDPQ